MSSVAIITPFFREPAWKLQRCIDSVRQQQYADIEHYLIGDGVNLAAEIALEPNEHFVSLPAPHGDYGNTPRTIGAICALNEGADVICFLDADNIYLPEHVSSLVEILSRSSLHAAFSYRYVFPVGYEDIRIVDQQDLARTHVDTSCMAVSKSAAFVLPMWALMPKALSGIGDRVFFQLLKHYQLRLGWTERYTVLYESHHAATFEQAGLPVPADAHVIDLELVRKNLDTAECLARLRTAVAV